jgi:selenocysteine lyase/cysteine desulfurase
VIGPRTSDAGRVSTISFVHATKPSREIAQAANAKGFGVRFGHFYAYRLCQGLGLDPADGVVRASMVHYNTMEEVDRLIACLDTLL